MLLSLVSLSLLDLFAWRRIQQAKLGLTDRVFPMSSSESGLGELEDKGSVLYQSRRDETTRGEGGERSSSGSCVGQTGITNSGPCSQ